MLNHLALSGGRVAASLSALEMGQSPFMVGVLLAMFAILPMLSSIAAGRLVDRIGVERPLVVGNVMVAASTLLCFIWPAPTTLILAAGAMGVGYMLHQVAAQRQLGAAPTTVRVRNFSWWSLSQSVSGLVGPLAAGLSIDYLGYRYAFGPLVLGPLIALACSRWLHGLLLPCAVHTSDGLAVHPRTRDLLAVPALRRVLGANVLISGAWDTHQFLLPLYGKAIGLSATTIGVVLATFAAATFVIRLALPYIQRRILPWTLVRAAMAGAGVSFLLYPFFQSLQPLMAVAFLLGLALGSTQPTVLALLHQHAPDNRVAEAFGIRIALINASQVSLPMACGLLATVTGLAPLFWACGLTLGSGVWFNRKVGVPVKKRKNEHGSASHNNDNDTGGSAGST